LHFHLPKPLHGWRALAGEIGIIVVGVLIALGAQQVAEDWHQRAELRDAEAAMTSELRDDDLPQAYTRAAITRCYADQLDSIESAIASGDRTRVLALARAYAPVIRTWDDQAWQAALASQVLAHSGAKRMLDWANAYVLIPALSQGGKEEQDELALLRPMMSGKGPLSAAQQDRLFRVTSVLRRDNERMTGGSLVFINFARNQGLTLTGDKKTAILTEARGKYGTCVKRPAPERINLRTQLTGTEARPID
jgi:hypothetical protein